MLDRIKILLAVGIMVAGVSTIALIYYVQSLGEPGFNDAKEAYDSGRYHSAFVLFRRLAHDRDVAAQHYLADMYENGLGTDLNKVEAFHWRLRLADLGDTYSMYWVGRSYFSGAGTRWNGERAIYWLRRGAELGQVQAQGWLGSLLFSGQGVEANEEEGLSWIMRAVDAGDPHAMVVLGRIHRDGDLGTRTFRRRFIGAWSRQRPAVLTDTSARLISSLTRRCRSSTWNKPMFGRWSRGIGGEMILAMHR